MSTGGPDAGFVAASLSEALTAQFYAWEQRGRGWQWHGSPVELEPPFRPFVRFQPQHQVLDDGRRPTWVSRMVERILRRVSASTPESPASLPTETDEDEASPPPQQHAEIYELSLVSAPDQRVPVDTAEALLIALANGPGPMSFEVVGTAERTEVQLAAPATALGNASQCLRAYLPELATEARQEWLAEQWQPNAATVIVDFGLSEEFMCPLATVRDFDPDPLAAVLGTMESVASGELAILQVLFQATQHPWATSILRAVTDNRGGAFFMDCPEMLPLARDKIESPLFAAIIRIVAQAAAPDRAWQLARSLATGLRTLDNPVSNQLMPLADSSDDPAAGSLAILQRQSCRTGMILNSRELVALVHPPGASVRLPKMVRQRRQTKSAPATVSGHPFILGENWHQQQRTAISLSLDQRLRHTYIVGATGTGKSTLLLRMIVQDLEAGRGVGVLDPHGDLVERVLSHVPESRIADVVLLDPADTHYPVGLNVLSARSEVERNVLASDLVAVFQRLATSWGDQMTSVLGNAVLAILESEQGGTLGDLRRFLVERDFRQELLRTVRDPEVVYYWQKEFPLLSGRPQGPVLTRLDTFLRPKPIRTLVTNRDCLDFQAILNRQRVFLARLPQGLIGQENAYLLGALLVSKFHQAALARQTQPETERPPFFLYVDEFQNFITPSMADILSGARKYGFGLILAHQELRQLWDQDKAVANSVLANPGTRICFRLGDADAKHLADGFSFFGAHDLQNLGVGEAICRVERADHDFNLAVTPVPTVPPALAAARQERIVALSRQTYGWPMPAANEATPSIPEPETAEQPRPSGTDTVGLVVTPTETPRLKRPKRAPVSPPTAGRGGPQHKYLQALIKQMAESVGFRASIEEAIPEGGGSVDVGLERDGLRIACEISITSTGQQEMGNIAKCLAAGYHQVIVCATQRQSLDRIEALTTARLPTETHSRISYLQPEALLTHLESLRTSPQGQTGMVKGYRVRVKYQPLDQTDRETKRETVARVIAGSLRRMKRES